MPLESLQTLQDLEITGPAGPPQQDETQYEPIEGDEQQPAQPFGPGHPSAPHMQRPSQAHSFEQPHPSPFYPPLLNSFGFDTASGIPIDPGLLDARFDHPAGPGPGGGGVAGFHRDPWATQPATSVNMDSFMVSPTSLPQYNHSMPLVPGMSSFEPMVSTAWSMDGSLTSTSTSTSRGPTMSSSLSVPGTSTPASSQSPSSPMKVSTGMIQPPAASKEAMPIHLGMQAEPRVEDQPSKKRRPASGPNVPPKTSVNKSHRNNSSPGFSTAPVPIAPAITAVAATGDDDQKNNNKKGVKGSSPKHQQTSTTTMMTTTTTTTASNAPYRPAEAGPSSQRPTHPAQQQQSPPQPDPRARNREAANRCRAKSKVAVAELEATERAMGAEHHALTQTARSLRDEVLQLKNQLLMHGNCDDEVIQQYLANSARLVGSGVLGVPALAGGGGGGGPPMQQQPPLVVAPPGGGVVVVGGGGGGSSSRATLPDSPPGMMHGHRKGGGGGARKH